MCVPTSSDKPMIRRAEKSKTNAYSRAEISMHNRKEDCWLIIENKVYDVTDFISAHPGGELLIINVAGRDVTDPFLANHPFDVPKKYLPMMQVGVVSDPVEPPEEVKRYRSLFKKFKDEGWYDTNYFYFARKILVYFTLLGLSIYNTVQGNWLIGSVFMGCFYQQVAFLGHDLGHNAVTHNRTLDWCLGTVFGPLLSGVSIGWWKATHNVHHLVTNSVEYDPDIQHLPVFAVVPEYFQDIYSYYHDRVFDFKNDKIAQFFVKYQHICYVPIMLLARFNLYIQSLLLVLDKKQAARRGIQHPMREVAAMGMFWAWFITLLTYIPGFWQKVAFLLISHGIGGILHVQITISHFPMETVSKTEGETFDSCENFVKHQLDTSMDVSCPRHMDWFHGGLQFQAVHHLYPRLPRHNLREASYLVQEMYEDKPNCVEYKAQPFWECLSMTVSTLKLTADQVGDFINAIG